MAETALLVIYLAGVVVCSVAFTVIVWMAFAATSYPEGQLDGTDRVLGVFLGSVLALVWPLAVPLVLVYRAASKVWAELTADDRDEVRR